MGVEPLFTKEQIAGSKYWSMVGTMSESPVAGAPAVRPAECPFCHGKAFDTLAKVISVNTWWRCRVCEGTWSIASQQAASPKAR
jgi:hypothetical protein